MHSILKFSRQELELHIVFIEKSSASNLTDILPLFWSLVKYVLVKVAVNPKTTNFYNGIARAIFSIFYS